MPTETRNFVGEIANQIFDGYAGFRLNKRYELTVEHRDNGTVAIKLDHPYVSLGAGPMVLSAQQYETWFTKSRLPTRLFHAHSSGNGAHAILASMKYLFFACCLLLTSSVQAQKRTTAAVAAPPIVFCNLLVEGQRLDKVELRLDYGQNSKAQAQDSGLAEADAQVQQLNSVAAGLNYMASQGWDFVSVTVMTRYGGGAMANNTFLGYLLRRRP